MGPATMKDEAKEGDLLVVYMGPSDANGVSTYARPNVRFLANVEHEGKTMRRFEWVRPRFEVSGVDNLSILDNKNARKSVVACVDPSLAKTICEDMNTRYA